MGNEKVQAAKPAVVEVTTYRIDLRGNSRRVALIGVYTAAYVAVVFAFPFISYGQLNIRVADFLRGLVPFFPEPLILGNALATFLSDLSSPFGYFDFLGSTVVIFVSMSVATRIFNVPFKGNILAGYIAHSIILSTWLTTLICSSVLGSFHFFDSAWLTFAVWIYSGNVVSDIVFPYLFFRVLRGRIMQPRLGNALTASQRQLQS